MAWEQQGGISRGGRGQTTCNNVKSTNKGENFFPDDLTWLNLPHIPAASPGQPRLLKIVLYLTFPPGFHEPQCFHTVYN